MRETFEVLDVVGEQVRYVVGQHRCYDIGVVDLFAADGALPNQIKKPFGYLSGIFGNKELIYKGANIRDQNIWRLRIAESLRTTESSQVFSQHLPADPYLRSSSMLFLDRLPGSLMKWARTAVENTRTFVSKKIFLASPIIVHILTPEREVLRPRAIISDR